jgi:hypothetical protein
MGQFVDRETRREFSEVVFDSVVTNYYIRLANEGGHTFDQLLIVFRFQYAFATQAFREYRAIVPRGLKAQEIAVVDYLIRGHAEIISTVHASE